jgi:hypothetical protein
VLPSASTPTAIAVRQEIDSVTSDAPAVAARASAGPDATRPATGTSSPCGPSARLAKDRSAVWPTSPGVATTNRSTSTACRRAAARARRTAREASIGSLAPSGKPAPPVFALPSSHGSANSVLLAQATGRHRRYGPFFTRSVADHFSAPFALPRCTASALLADASTLPYPRTRHNPPSPWSSPPGDPAEDR